MEVRTASSIVHEVVLIPDADPGYFVITGTEGERVRAKTVTVNLTTEVDGQMPHRTPPVREAMVWADGALLDEHAQPTKKDKRVYGRILEDAPSEVREAALEAFRGLGVKDPA